MANKTSQHILSTSANLLGFCLFVITALHFSSKEELTYIDEFTTIISIFLTVSCIFSFLSIRTDNELRGRRMESVADYVFLIALLGIFVVIVFIAVDVVK